jgi:hypothetical protein
MTIDLNQCVVFDGEVETRGRKRTHFKDRASTAIERMKVIRKSNKARRIENIAVLDMETDPFDHLKQEAIFPFVACLYSHNFDPVVIWEENHELFVQKVLEAIENLPEEYTIYAHNGGKFDYMFLVHRLRGRVSFKGRGIMSAKIGNHELRDSFHIIPEKLAAYQKETFDYEKMRKSQRGKWRQQIIDYLISDCKYLLEIVQGFLNKFGLKISIGQAAMAELRKHYKVQTIGENTDATLRQYFFGGRVECLAGCGHFIGDYKLYDVNSMYPFAMANYSHPISSDYTKRQKGGITEKTIFIELSCENNGALVRRGMNNETSATERNGKFLTTVWEYQAALDLGLIDKVKIHSVIDCAEVSDFRKFVEPLYEARQETKRILKSLKNDTSEYAEAKREDIFTKLLLNNAYGKFAQNPRRFKESTITETGAEPPEGYECPIPAFECPEYSIWQRPSLKRRYNNVGTAASITGAARAVLMRAIANAENPIYCDTDSLICTNLSNVEIHPQNLGAWDIEAEFSEVIVTGKKQYACRVAGLPAGHKDEFKIRSKGVSGLIWADFVKMLDGEIIEVMNKAPTLTKTGKQFYMSRKVRATAPTPMRSEASQRKVA